jgi:hypothetical protein
VSSHQQQDPTLRQLTRQSGETELRPEPTGGNFLERERAALGEDADLFASNDAPKQTATVEDDDDDLLGGGGNDNFSAPSGPTGAGQEPADDFDGFESSFPAIDTRNDVRSHYPPSIPPTQRHDLTHIPERRPWRLHNQHNLRLHQLQRARARDRQ